MGGQFHPRANAARRRRNEKLSAFAAEVLVPLWFLPRPAPHLEMLLGFSLRMSPINLGRATGTYMACLAEQLQHSRQPHGDGHGAAATLRASAAPCARPRDRSS